MLYLSLTLHYHLDWEEYEYNIVSPVDTTASPDDDESCVRSKKASLTLVVDGGAMTDNKKAQPDDKIIRMHMYKQFGRVTDWSQVLVVVVLGYIFAIGSSAQYSYSWWPKAPVRAIENELPIFAQMSIRSAAAAVVDDMGTI